MLDGVLKLSMQVVMVRLLHRAEEVWLTTAHARTEQLDDEVFPARRLLGRIWQNIAVKFMRCHCNCCVYSTSVAGCSFVLAKQPDQINESYYVWLYYTVKHVYFASIKFSRFE